MKKSAAAIATAATLGLALAGCVNSEKPSTAPGTTPSVVTGERGAPGGIAQDTEGHGAEHEGSTATAKLVDAANKQIGTAVFTEEGKGIHVTVTVTGGLTPGFHGMHIHSNGVCDPSGAEPFSSAGGHLQVEGHTGHPSSGDLVSIYIGANGEGATTTSSEAVTLKQITGKALVIHAGADNFGNIPDRYSADGRPGPDEKTLMTGDAGGRAACGVIDAG
ncbi:superoxide dismutase family protein [Gordonia sp. X0973]|uniref:superoxide dismutase family protein n=1 Tax=Gordonia sp. X0973 TaxID=2742602 RepID=UPI000F542D6A|nr:superoxide dismutase family protein [Gordonia sp. X0973]QKT06129.1 superoxide dismutase family protein [Gordonia sp. X0973]